MCIRDRYEAAASIQNDDLEVITEQEQTENAGIPLHHQTGGELTDLARKTQTDSTLSLQAASLQPTPPPWPSGSSSALTDFTTLPALQEVSNTTSVEPIPNQLQTKSGLQSTKVTEKGKNPTESPAVYGQDITI